MPTHAKSHEENRKYVCLLCLKKSSRPLTAFQAQRICELYSTNLDVCDSRVPQGLCESCRTALRRKEEGKEVTLPSLFDFSSIRLRAETRSQVCDCLLCQIARSKLQDKHPLEKQNAGEKEPSVRCHECLSPLGKGLPHQCSQLQFRQNLQSLAAKDSKAAEQIASQVIANKESSPRGTVKLAKAGGGPPLSIKPGKYFNFIKFLHSLLV